MTKFERKAKDKFKDLSESLSNRISQILELDTEPNSISDKINNVLTKEQIWLPEDYLQDFFSGKCTKASIDPLKVAIKQESDNMTCINANAFGPYIPEEYFRKNNFRILWILDEPYIKQTWYTKNDRGGHLQATYYNTWQKVIEEDHYISKKIIPIVKEILNKMVSQLGVMTNPLNEQDAMSHLCCLEINHFPGIGLNNTKENDYYINRWGAINQPMIRSLIDFYRPHLILGAAKNLGIATDLDDFELFNWLRPHNNNLDNYPNTTEISLATRRALDNKRIVVNGTTDNDTASAILDSKGTIWVGWKHPSNRNNLWANQELIGWISNLCITWPIEYIQTHNLSHMAAKDKKS